MAAGTQPVLVQAIGLQVAHGDQVVLHGLDFDIRAGEVLVILGASGCGKSSLLRDLVGLGRPHAGQVLLDGQDLHAASAAQGRQLRQRFGVMFQAGALWSALSVGQNLMLPLRLLSGLPPAAQARQARLKLALVGLDGSFDLMPAQLSGGMRKRAALARALVLDPPLLYLDEPGSGLDPLNAARLDELVLQLRQHLGTTVVLVTHDIQSALAVADRVLFLDEDTRTMTALDSPARLLSHGPAAVRRFLHRGQEALA
ncbi:MAG: ATP-binding cassette domain-containing protein [Rubrivivax sp.]|nr:ATP-binding cassette domain-containing protein [Rubrivivax sp.]